MCLFIKSGPHVAGVDRVVWKVIWNRGNISIHRDFKYKPNTLYKKVKIGLCPFNEKIFDGYHAYRNRDFAYDMLTRPDLNYKMVKFIIPAGSTYYIGDIGDIVSDRIQSGDLTAMKRRG